jgi:DnaJ-class molecular chaperone
MNINGGNTNNPFKDPVIHHLKCTLEQIIKEENVSFSYKQSILCNDCNGSGGRDISVCNICKGNGMCMKVAHIGPIQHQSMMPCDKCKGKGRIIKTICRTCNGETRVSIMKSETIKLKNGLEDNMRLTVKSKGNMISQENYGDLIIHINIEPHEVFKREGANLFVDLELNLYEALFGFTKMIYHLDGRVLCVKYTGKTEYGTYRKIRREGFFNLHNPSEHGNLYICFTFYLPDVQNVYEIEKMYEHSREDSEDCVYSFLEDIDKHELDKDSPRYKQHQQEDEQPRQPECRQM